jgi:hypothetical protein
MTMRERRTDIRLDVCLDAVWDGNGGNSPARVTDLSEGGCYIDSICEACVGEILHLKVQLPDDEWLDLVGEVAHCFARVGFGLRFVNLESAQLEKLRWVIEHLKQPHEHLASKICA